MLSLKNLNPTSCKKQLCKTDRFSYVMENKYMCDFKFGICFSVTFLRTV